MLLFIDNIFRFTQAGSEVSALLGRMPSAVGYQPTLGTEMGELQERITSTKKGSITSVQAIYVPADDITDPAPATAFAHLDATTVLSRADRRARHLPGRGPARLHLAHPRSAHPGRGALRDGARRAVDPAALQGPPGHHRHPRHGRALRRGQADRGARPQDPALPLAAVLRGRGVHRPAGPLRQARGHHPGLQGDRRGQARRHCPSRPSTWSAASRRRARRRARCARSSNAAGAGHADPHARHRRGRRGRGAGRRGLLRRAARPRRLPDDARRAAR